MGQIGIWQIVIVAVVVILLFGRGKISAVMGDVAKGINSFKKGLKEETATDNKSESIAHTPAENIATEVKDDTKQTS
ncbi:MAG: twin-arginine translocase TatA/TatE family subunit [Hyphomicrobiales bacterium]|nr:MAG: twin-arginine translocase TatA/TatE family subunit [Hyphomicrobiales bacterium]